MKRLEIIASESVQAEVIAALDGVRKRFPGEGISAFCLG